MRNTNLYRLPIGWKILITIGAVVFVLFCIGGVIWGLKLLAGWINTVFALGATNEHLWAIAVGIGVLAALFSPRVGNRTVINK